LLLLLHPLLLLLLQLRLQLRLLLLLSRVREASASSPGDIHGAERAALPLGCGPLLFFQERRESHRHQCLGGHSMGSVRTSHLGKVVSTMKAARLGSLAPHLRELVARFDSQTTDRELLGRFNAEGDEDAFAEIVRRHGPMVVRVGRRVLRNGHDAEDIAQAAFLLLARKASCVRWQDSVTGWLYQTAFRLSMKAKVAARRRARLESRAQPIARTVPQDELTARELQDALDEELARLPERYRAPIVL